MPDVEFALLANAAQVSSDQLISMLSGGWDTGTLPEEAYPAGIVLNVVFRVLFEADEVGKAHAGEVTVEGEGGERLATVTFTMNVQSVEGLPPGWKTNVSAVTPVPVQIPRPGLYTVSIGVDGNLLKRIPLRMKVAGA
jgi:Family of unknown function (DUF6941)